MDLIFMDGNFKHISNPVDGYTSLTWSENWYSTGTFALYLPPAHIGTVRNASHIYNRDNDKCAMITSINYTETNLIVKGQMLESILSKRVIDRGTTLNDTLENAVYAAITRYCLTGDRKIDKLELSPTSGFSDAYEGMTEEGMKLDSWLYEILKPYEMSYRIDYDYYNDKLIFKLVKGLDRTQSQDDNTWAMFSANFENLSNIAYEKSTVDYYNYVYAVGKYNNSRVVEIVDETDGNERRELYIAPSMSSDENPSTLTRYRNLLKQKGAEALAEYKIVETVTGDAMAGSLVYGVNYNIGDLCDIVIPDLLEVPISERITAVDFVYEPTGSRVIPRFGEGAINIRKLIEREMKK